MSGSGTGGGSESGEAGASRGTGTGFETLREDLIKVLTDLGFTRNASIKVI